MTVQQVDHKDMIGQSIRPKDVVIHPEKSGLSLVTKITEQRVVLNGKSVVAPASVLVVTSNIQALGERQKIDDLIQQYSSKIDLSTTVNVATKPLRFVPHTLSAPGKYTTTHVLLLEVRGTAMADYHLAKAAITPDLSGVYGLSVHEAGAAQPPLHYRQTTYNKSQAWSPYFWSIKAYLFTLKRLAEIGADQLPINTPIPVADWNNAIKGIEYEV